MIQDFFYKSRKETFKYELLTLQSGQYRSNGYITEYIENGSININLTRDVVGNCNLQMVNNKDINYLSDLIRPYICINEKYEYPMGTYMLVSPEKDSNGTLVTRNIQGYDLLLALEQDKTITSNSYPAGSNVIETIKTILSSVGTWVKHDIVESNQVLATDISYELGKSKLFIINSLLNMINYYPLWADGNGVFRGIPWNSITNVTHEFIDNEYSLYESGIKQNLDYSDMYNRVVVINNQLAENTAPLYKVWTMEDEGLSKHPYSYTSLGRYVSKIFNSDAVSQDYVNLRAKRELLKMTEIEEAVNYNHAFISSRSGDGLPWQGDSYRFKNTLLDVDSIYRIESMSWDLSVGSMVQAKINRIRSTFE